jgi:hypothetical protein
MRAGVHRTATAQAPTQKRFRNTIRKRPKIAIYSSCVAPTLNTQTETSAINPLVFLFARLVSALSPLSPCRLLKHLEGTWRRLARAGEHRSLGGPQRKHA